MIKRRGGGGGAAAFMGCGIAPDFL